MERQPNQEAKKLYREAYSVVNELRILEAEDVFADHRQPTTLDLVGGKAYEKARRILEECVSLDPNFVLAHKELALVLRKLGENEEAIRHRRIVKRLSPDDIVNRYNLAKVLNDTRQYREALQEAEELAELQPNDVRILRLLENLRSRPPKLGRISAIFLENIILFIVLALFASACYWLLNWLISSILR